VEEEPSGREEKGLDSNHTSNLRGKLERGICRGSGGRHGGLAETGKRGRRGGGIRALAWKTRRKESPGGKQRSVPSADRKEGRSDWGGQTGYLTFELKGKEVKGKGPTACGKEVHTERGRGPFWGAFKRRISPTLETAPSEPRFVHLKKKRGIVPPKTVYLYKTAGVVKGSLLTKGNPVKLKKQPRKCTEHAGIAKKDGRRSFRKGLQVLLFNTKGETKLLLSPRFEIGSRTEPFEKKAG